MTKNISTCIMLFVLGFPGRSTATDVLFSKSFVKYSAESKAAFQTVSPEERVVLSGARNETLSFQLIFTAKKENIRTLEIKMSDFEGPGIFRADHVALYELERCQKNGSPDCLIPVGPRALLRPKAALETRGWYAVWADVFIPEDTRPGEYQGYLTLREDGAAPNKIYIKLKVYPFSLPQKPSLTVDLNNYGLGFLKAFGVKPGSKDALRAIEKFYLFARAHRMLLNPLPYKSQRGRPHPGMAPVLAGEGVAKRVKDWRAYDAYYGPLFSGALFNDKRPVSHQYLPFNPEWPSDFSNFHNDREKYEAEWRAIAQEFMTHFKEKGWDKTVFQIFLNQKPNKNNHIPWNLDEPKGEKDYRALRYYADLTQNVFQNHSQFGFRIDISHFYCEKHKGHPDKDFEKNNGASILEPVDIWVISKHSMDDVLPQQKAQTLKAQGKTIFEYMAGSRMPLIDEPLIKAVHYGWLAWLRNEDGLVFWSTIKKRTGVSDGRDFLIYPEDNQGILGPVASLRLKAIRRGIQDFEYFRLVSDQQRMRALIKDYLSNDASDHEELRHRAAALIINATHKNG